MNPSEKTYERTKINKSLVNRFSNIASFDLPEKIEQTIHKAIENEDDILNMVKCAELFTFEIEITPEITYSLCVYRIKEEKL